MRSTRIPGIVSAVLAVVGGLVIGSAEPALAGGVEWATCGQTVTSDVALAEDLECAEAGLVIGADGVEVDLRGHTLTAPGNAISDGSTGAYGSHAGWRLRNGTVAGDVLLGGSDDIVVTGVRILGDLDARFGSATVSGGEVSGTVMVKMADPMTMTGTKVGYLSSSDGDNVSCTACTIARGAYFFESDNVAIRRSVVQGTIVLYITNHKNDTYRAVISDNLITAPDYGVALMWVHNAEITRNTFRGNRFGIEMNILQWNTAISRNLFLNNGAAGIVSDGFTDDAEHPTTISNNVFVRNGWSPDGATDKNGNPIADGIHIVAPNYTGNHPAVVNGNLTTGSAAYGIYAEPGTAVNTGARNISRLDRLGCSGIVCS